MGGHDSRATARAGRPTGGGGSDMPALGAKSATVGIGVGVGGKRGRIHCDKLMADCRALEVVPLKGAMTNEAYQVCWLTTPAEAGAGAGPLKEGEVRKVSWMRFTGVDLFFDREDELRTFECMSATAGPRLGRFPNDRVEEFIHARVGAYRV
ncbi:hypothetical protein ZWY2020_051223 [Hordeum vulgare]|nr:hypothetical protein ZWY2020_051223 [Hordeum vulgare]